MTTHQISSAELRLSACRAFLGLIRPEFRRIGVTLHGEEIRLLVLLDDDSDQIVEIVEDVETAAAEIVADFPGARIRTDFGMGEGPLATVDIFADGLIYQRWEKAHAQ